MMLILSDNFTKIFCIYELQVLLSQRNVTSINFFNTLRLEHTTGYIYPSTLQSGHYKLWNTVSVTIWSLNDKPYSSCNDIEYIPL